MTASFFKFSDLLDLPELLLIALELTQHFEAGLWLVISGLRSVDSMSQREITWHSADILSNGNLGIVREPCRLSTLSLAD